MAESQSRDLVDRMITAYLSAVIVRELDTLKRELAAYDDESQIWRTPAGISNSAGTLTLHVTGNLQHFIGAMLGDTGYVRDRKAEFSRRGVPCSALFVEIDRTIAAVKGTLAELPPRRLEEPFPQKLAGSEVTIGDFLIHLATHLAFHLGQIDYHRRLLTDDHHSIGPLAIKELESAG